MIAFSPLFNGLLPRNKFVKLLTTSNSASAATIVTTPNKLCAYHRVRWQCSGGGDMGNFKSLQLGAISLFICEWGYWPFSIIKPPRHKATFDKVSLMQLQPLQVDSVQIKFMKMKGFIQAEEKFCSRMEKQEQVKIVETRRLTRSGEYRTDEELDDGVGDDGTEPPDEEDIFGVCWSAGS